LSWSHIHHHYYCAILHHSKLAIVPWHRRVPPMHASNASIALITMKHSHHATMYGPYVS
jgi:hypothetical protein